MKPDPLVAACLPVLVHGMNNTTQLLSNLSALLQLQGEQCEVESLAPDLGRATGEVERSGYVLALLASASGAELMLARREARGLEWMIDSLRKVLRRDGLDLADCETSIPDLHSASRDGWSAAWAVASCLLVAARAAAEAALTWGFESLEVGHALTGSAGGSAVKALAGRLEERTGAGLEVQGEAWTLLLPAGWLGS